MFLLQVTKGEKKKKEVFIHREDTESTEEQGSKWMSQTSRLKTK